MIFALKWILGAVKSRKSTKVERVSIVYSIQVDDEAMLPGAKEHLYRLVRSNHDVEDEGISYDMYYDAETSSFFVRVAVDAATERAGS
jgi:hypothetical protein